MMTILSPDIVRLEVDVCGVTRVFNFDPRTAVLNRCDDNESDYSAHDFVRHLGVQEDLDVQV